MIFRCVRLVFGAAVFSSTALYTREVVDQATSEQAYLNGEITTFKAPISGQLHLQISPGRALAAGAPLFTIENPRFGNQEVAAQLNWATESAERLQAESEEAAVRFKQQEEVCRIHQRLYDEQVLSRLEMLDQESKLATARTAMTHKQTLAAQAIDRSEKIKKQLELQKAATVTVPFAAVAWTVPAKNGAEVSTHETIVEVVDPNRIWVDAFFHEKHAEKLAAGTSVHVRTLDGAISCNGTVEWVRAGVGRIPYEGNAAVAPGDYTRRRVGVRVRLETNSPFSSREFFGVGRSVIVTLARS